MMHWMDRKAGPGVDRASTGWPTVVDADQDGDVTPALHVTQRRLLGYMRSRMICHRRPCRASTTTLEDSRGELAAHAIGQALGSFATGTGAESEGQSLGTGRRLFLNGDIAEPGAEQSSANCPFEVGRARTGCRSRMPAKKFCVV